MRKISNFSRGALKLDHLAGMLDLINSELDPVAAQGILMERFGGGR